MGGALYRRRIEVINSAVVIARRVIVNLVDSRAPSTTMGAVSSVHCLIAVLD